MNILLPGDAMEQEPVLADARNKMPEPTRVDYPYMRTLRTVEAPMFCTDAESFSPVSYQTDQWERIRICERGLVYSAWRHIASQAIFL